MLLCSFVSIAKEHPRKFKSGDQLPDLILIDAFGDTIQPDDLKGHKILITFNRYVSCPLCNYRTHELLEHYDTLKNEGLIFISIYESQKQTLLEYTTKEEIPFVMIADPLEILYKQFKVQRSWWKNFIGFFKHFNQKHSAGKKYFKAEYERDGHLNRIGADFLVDEKGIIQTAYYGKYVGDHYPVEDIIRWVMNKN